MGALPIENALGAIEESILPNLALLLDSAMESARTAPSAASARELQLIARQLAELTDFVTTMVPRSQPAAEAPVRISA